MIAFVHPQSISHGVDGFQNVCHIIVGSPCLRLGPARYQIIERIGPMRRMRAGFDREVLVYQIIARDTIDEIVAERLVEQACSTPPWTLWPQTERTSYDRHPSPPTLTDRGSATAPFISHASEVTQRLKRVMAGNSPSAANR